MRNESMSRAVSFYWCIEVYALAAAAACGAVVFAPDSWSPIAVAAVADLVATLVVFGGSMAFDNSSIYDPYWSVAPPVIAIFWTVAYRLPLGWHTVAMIALVVVWAVRLTVNCFARWQGMGHEDWRYAQYRSRGSYWLISFAGFHLMPTAIVFAGCLPLAVAAQSARLAYPALALVALVLSAAAIALEWIADMQLARFKRESASGGSALLQSGVWSLVRHPNYLGEILFWWGLALCGLAVNPRAWWALAGAVAITVLFTVVSIPMMNRRLAARVLRCPKGQVVHA